MTMFNGAALIGRLSVMPCNPGCCPGLVGIALSARFVGSKNDEGKERRGWKITYFIFLLPLIARFSSSKRRQGERP